MTDRELMNLAFEALYHKKWFRIGLGKKSDPKVDAAITALTERLAHCDRCGKKLGGEGDIHTCSPQRIAEQEPVGYEHHVYSLYGAPGEVRIRVVLASQFKLPNGSISGDFQWLIDEYRADPNTIKLVPLYKENT